jgi:hypothetical protein
MRRRQGTGSANRLHEETLILSREMEDRIGIAATLNLLGEVALPRRELRQARLPP